MAARDKHGPEAPGDQGFRIVGKENRKVDGMAKATGEAIYTDDIMLPGMLHAKMLRSPHAHARILSVDTSKAEALPGVLGVLVGAELPIRYGVIPWTPDENALAVDKVRFIGDEIAAVAAVDEDTANEAIDLIEVEYEILDAILDPQVALVTPEPPIHEDRKRRDNISKHVDLEFGDVEAQVADAGVVIEDDYSFHSTTHTPIEPHCAVAQPNSSGRLTLWSSTQITHYVHRALARVLELDPARIRVIQPCLGGGFGGKSDPFSLEFVVAQLALKTGRPVKMLWTREEVFYAHRGRHPMQMHYRTTATADGMITGVDAKLLIDGGSYSSFGLVTTYYSGQLLTGPYSFPNYRFDSTRVFTNKPPNGPKRGHGSVQPRFAFEVQLDEVASKLEIDPIEIRRRNFLGEHTETVNGQRVTSNGFLECLDEVESASEWKQRRGRMGYGRGLGVAGSMYISGTNYPVYPNKMPQAGVQLKIDRSGLVTVFTGGNDIGQGSNSMVAYVVAEELGITPEHIQVVAADTDLCPVDLGAYSSRVTFMVGNAAIDGARKLRKQIVAAVAAHWEVEERDVRLIEGTVVDLSEAARSMSHVEAFHLAEEMFDTLGSTGSYNTPTLGGDYRGGTIGASPAYSFTAHVAEVEVDTETGRITVHKVWAAHDCGRALNPVIVRGQIEGSTYMGAAEVVLENHDLNRFGLHA
ncbi:MAG: xanthine dehydrogenase family protein molybdopterin-binding subunit, partial [Planctomycetota bacterium]